jgi:SSS family solute:Na+ symporter
VASVFTGLGLSAVFVTDALSPRVAATLPFLHQTLTENYTYRGAWGTLIITVVLFAVSAVTRKTDKEKLAKTTIDWGGKPEPFRGITDWRLHLAVLSVVTVVLYWWMW